MINLILFGLGIALICGMGLFFAMNNERAARQRREASRKLKNNDSSEKRQRTNHPDAT